jgi:pSer/pThr/pTyr-binding forkhead associated (FHA) protein
VVVSGKDVSRRHAEIVQTPKGYLVVDSSTNGTFVNEVRVEGQRLLARADVIRLGDENFRFYADAAQAAPNPKPGPAASAPPAVPPPQGPSSPPPPPPPPAPPVGAGQRLKETLHGTPAPVLGNFLVRSGALKGQRFVVKTPVANIGRADYNDLVIPDESVSTTHAKLQRREGVWVLVDLDSTNGTFVDGERVKGETPLSPGVTVRFGDIPLVFEPTDDSAAVAKGGGTRMMEAMKPKAPPPPPAKAKPKAKPPVAEQKKPGKGCGGSAAILMLAFVAVVYWVLI